MKVYEGYTFCLHRYDFIKGGWYFRGSFYIASFARKTLHHRVLYTVQLNNFYGIIKLNKFQTKKQPVEFGADNIDNTAPVKTILDELQFKNTQAFTFYAQTIRQRTTKEKTLNYHFAITGHPLHAFPDDWEGGLHSGFFESFTYKSLMPKMITEMCNIEKFDPVTHYMKLKRDWHQDLRFLRLSACKYSVFLTILKMIHLD